MDSGAQSVTVADYDAGEESAASRATRLTRAALVAEKKAADAQVALAEVVDEARATQTRPPPVRGRPDADEHRSDKFKWYRLAKRTILDSATQKLVLWCLASHAWSSDPIGDAKFLAVKGYPPPRDGECVLLVRTIAHETALGRRAVLAALSGLEKAGVIERTSRGRRGGGRGANSYLIIVPVE